MVLLLNFTSLTLYLCGSAPTLARYHSASTWSCLNQGPFEGVVSLAGVWRSIRCDRYTLHQIFRTAPSFQCKKHMKTTIKSWTWSRYQGVLGNIRNNRCWMRLLRSCHRWGHVDLKLSTLCGCSRATSETCAPMELHDDSRAANNSLANGKQIEVHQMKSAERHILWTIHISYFVSVPNKVEIHLHWQNYVRISTCKKCM